MNPGKSARARPVARESTPHVAEKLPSYRIDPPARLAGLDPLQVHDAVSEGLPTREVEGLIAQFRQIPKDHLLRALGVSERTLQRHKGGKLGSDIASAAVDLATTVEAAARTLGSLEAAEHWLGQPAVAFNGRCPIDLLSTRQGADLVREHLVRMEYGVYA
jgi:putative toxin-antitoxin system antitoxin component (TIGR02293 family)